MVDRFFDFESANDVLICIDFLKISHQIIYFFFFLSGVDDLIEYFIHLMRIFQKMENYHRDQNFFDKDFRVRYIGIANHGTWIQDLQYRDR